MRDRRTGWVGAARDEAELWAVLRHRNRQREPLAVAHFSHPGPDRIVGDQVEGAALVIATPASPVVDRLREREELVWDHIRLLVSQRLADPARLELGGAGVDALEVVAA